MQVVQSCMEKINWFQLYAINIDFDFFSLTGHLSWYM